MKRVYSFFKKMGFLSILLISSCSNPSLKEYLEYWSGTVQLGKVDVQSQYTVINQQCNVNGTSDVVLDLLVINPQEYELLCKENPDAPSSSFSVVDENGTIAAQNIDVKQISSDIIQVSMQLFDENEGKRLTLSGNLYPRNMQQLWEESVCTWSFIQNSPPDNIKNLDNRKNNSYQGKHYVSFNIPDQKKQRNKDISYNINCYLNGSVINSAIVNQSDNKSSSNTEFHYYFDNQADNIYYDYSVQVIDSTGLTNELVSTVSGIGIQQIVEPSITFNIQTNGYTDENGYEYYELDDNQLLTYTIQKNNSEDRVSCIINGVASSGVSADLGVNTYDIKITTSRDGCYSVETSKKIKVVKKLKTPRVNFTGNYINSQMEYDVYQFSYLSYNKMPYNISAHEEGETVTVKIDGSVVPSAADGNNSLLSEGNHIIEIEVQKPYQRPRSDTLYLTVQIIPIKLGIGKNTSGYYTINPNNFGADKWDLKGQIYLNGKTVFSYEKSKLEVHQNKDNIITDYAYGEVFTLETVDSTIAVTVTELRRNIGGGEDKRFCGTAHYDCGTRTLQQIKNAGWMIDTGTLKGDSNRQIRLKFYFEVSE